MIRKDEEALLPKISKSVSLLFASFSMEKVIFGCCLLMTGAGGDPIEAPSI